MNRSKGRIPVLVCVILTALNIVACGQGKRDEVVNIDEASTNQRESSVQEIESTDSEIEDEEPASTNSEIEDEEPENTDDSFLNQQESSTQTDENIDTEMTTEMTTEELLDLFIDGSISAIRSEDSTSTFYITDLDMDSDEWDSFSIGERVDLDNDGEDELIICGPYGGIYIDARDNKVYEFAAGKGTGYMLSYVVYNGATWIMYSNRTHAGYKLYHMEKYEGADNLVAEMDFGEELVDEDNVESGMKYTLNGLEISCDEFEELASKIFATEVYTTK